jgi:hypothetical protein
LPNNISKSGKSDSKSDEEEFEFESLEFSAVRVVGGDIAADDRRD